MNPVLGIAPGDVRDVMSQGWARATAPAQRADGRVRKWMGALLTAKLVGGACAE